MSDPVPAKPVHTTLAPLAEVFQGQALRDQYDKPFDPAQLQNGPVIVFTFYGDCPRCGLSTRTIAALQQEFLRRGQKVQIVGISVKPERDSKPGRGKYITTGYYERGIKQFSGETDTEKKSDDAYETAASLPAQDRLFHILRAPDTAAALEIQRRLGHVTAGPESHTAVISLYHNGKFVEHYQGLPKVKEVQEKDGEKKEIWRDITTDDFDDGLDKPENLASQVRKYAAQQLAPAVSDRIARLNALPEKPAPSVAPSKPAPQPEGLNTASLWNFGLPAVAAILVAMVSEGSGMMKLLWAVLAGGGVSVLTQWVTGKGIFAETKPAPQDNGHAKQPEKPPHEKEKEKHVGMNTPDYEHILKKGTPSNTPRDTAVVVAPRVPQQSKEIEMQV